MGTWEFPLVLFTVVGQWAIGLALMLTIVMYLFPGVSNEENRKHLRIGGMAVLPLIGLGLIFSIFHLGQPFAAYRAILNLGTSMLSLEILAFLLVGLLALAYSYLWWKKPESSSIKLVGAGLSVVGLGAIIISSQVYTLPARLAWNSWQTTAAFLLTAILLGAVSVALLLSKTQGEDAEKAKKAVGYIVIAAVLAIIVVLALFARTYGLSTEQSAAVAATFGSGFFFVRLILGLLLPVAIAGLFIASRKSCNKFLTIALVGVVLGEVAGRILFYSSVMGQYPWF